MQENVITLTNDIESINLDKFQNPISRLTPGPLAQKIDVSGGTCSEFTPARNGMEDRDLYVELSADSGACVWNRTFPVVGLD